MKFKVSTLLAWFAVGTAVAVVLYDRINLHSIIEAAKERAINEERTQWNALLNLTLATESNIILAKCKHRSKKEFESFSNYYLRQNLVKLYFTLHQIDKEIQSYEEGNWRITIDNKKGVLLQAGLTANLLDLKSPESIEISEDMITTASLFSEKEDFKFSEIEQDFREFCSTAWHYGKFHKTSPVVAITFDGDPQDIIVFAKSAIFLLEANVIKRDNIRHVEGALDNLPAKFQAQKDKFLLELRSIEKQE